ncbi:drug/metabolite transporter (DMT)-like permease [Cupriavidus metallidurans]|jgi:drug/metabolite transporter (DMT)-like permease|uniref:EamA family transporter n=1 Tax=Cupriavidus TaxID=106589 RepID=UPI000492F755|nr:EamA family transporter [Cupriavidus metallidurans]KWW37235.1 4-amino-4-deoxy-L-arabinose-phosphoundecaprenol flippase subunit ArnE [Cupriavidus metallidurans]
MITYLVAVLCVVGLAMGQILFKVSANTAHAGGSFIAYKPLAALLAAMCLYGVTSLAWVWVLQRTELGKVYPLMALAFLLVPIGSHIIFGERFQMQYVFGVAFIMLGVILTSNA